MDAVHVSPEKEFLDFITSAPSLEAIANYRLSPEADAYISTLLAANRNGTITPQESIALGEYSRLEHMMRLIKYRALEKLAETE